MSLMLSLGHRQQQGISARMQQAVQLLRLSALDFECALRDAASQNPFLEVDDEELAPPVEQFAFERQPLAGGGGDDASLSWIAARGGLREHLREQLYASRRPEREVLAAEAIIESLDDDGFLREDLARIARLPDIHPPLGAAEMAAALALIRGFDPAGVAAGSLVECLRLQLQALPADVPGRGLALRVLDGHADCLQRRDLAGLRRALDCGEAALRRALALIRRLDPDPAGRYAARAPEYIVPDVLVEKRGGGWVARLNPQLGGGIRLNDYYIDLFRRQRRGTHPAMAEQLQEARWLVRSIEQRFETIRRVACYIVERQQGFFAAGDIALRPMLLREVADGLDLHESTVSRATSGKFMATPRGCLEFKRFFSRQLAVHRGPACSAVAVRSLIQALVAGEDAAAPLSDVALAEELRGQGIRIARRTVTKYRQMLKIPAVELRRAD